MASYPYVMRAMWCTLVALCLVTGGAQPHRAQRSPDGAATLRVAHASQAASVRRVSAELGPFVVADAIAAPAPARSFALFEMPAPHQAPAFVLASARSSRGPPHA